VTAGQAVVEGGPVLGPGENLAAGYAVVEHLHRSRYLDVYEVWSEERTCGCVAKVVRPDRVRDQKARHALIREGRLLQRLTHPHIVRAYEVVEQPDPLLLLETLTGDTLAYIIEEEQRLPLKDVAYLGLHLCSAVRYLHRHGFLHLDLKPDNIISCCRLAKVIDFSIAQPPGPAASKGPGTPVYMAPEQVTGGFLSAATDVWGVGSVLYEALTGQPPFDVPDDDDDEEADSPEGFPRIEGRARSLRVHRRLPSAVVAAIDGCLEPDPAQRPSLDVLYHTLKTVVSP
jgi:serine/threonine protein kinase